MSSSSDNDSEPSALHNLYYGDSDDDSEDDASYENDAVIREGQLHLVGDNLPGKTDLFVKTAADSILEPSEQNWETLGREIEGSEHLLDIYITVSMVGNVEGSETENGFLSDEHMTSLFKGLTRSNTIRSMNLSRNGFGVSGVQAMVPFLIISSSIVSLNLGHNNIQSEGFNIVFRALRDSPIEFLMFGRCGVENLEIDGDHIPKCLRFFSLVGNNINSEGCRELTKFLKKENATLEMLGLKDSNIDDEGVAILVDALRKNTSLKVMTLDENDGITMRGKLYC